MLTLTRHRTDVLLLAAVLCAAVAAWLVFDSTRDTGGSSGQPASPPAASSEIAPATDAGRPGATDATIASLQATAGERPDDAYVLASLGLAYLQKVRETADATFYGKADEVLNRAIAADSSSLEALVGLASLAAGRHDFAAAERYGHQALAIDDHTPAVYGIIADAQVEQGKYDDAVKTVQAMVDLRPDLSSYARVSYLRELYGDRDGAIVAMRQAVEAGSGVPEHEAWTRSQLGDLLFAAGKLDEAARQYARSLDLLPGYPRALLGQGRLAAARGDLPGAIAAFQGAVDRAPLPEYVIALGDAYTLAGDTASAAKQYDLVGVEERLLAQNGVNTDLEFALFDLDHDRDLPAALDAAKRAYPARPGIHGADVLAWAYYKNGDCNAAAPLIKEALRLGTKDGLLLFHAGMVAECLGDRAGATSFYQQALATNPNFSLLFAPVARDHLAALTGSQTP